jgi:hypothetical protein
MPIYTKNGLKVLFIHISKTGGKTIEAWFRNFGWEERLIYSNFQFNSYQYWINSKQYKNCNF